MAFESLTDEKIQQLAQMPKRVKNPTARMVADANHDKKEFLLESEDGAEQFRVFVRQNKTVTDDFSCGIQWQPAGSEPLILARFNGSSHEHPNHLEGEKLSLVCHVHRTTERYIRANRAPEGYAQATQVYTTCSGALHALTVEFNISGIETNPDHPELALS
ncbi:MAG: hypothetical protein NTV08_02030 [Verrucomicrobia bacterium]|jgi:hypothetical protein|nr:hypothetical protein [Verrucomicrobiota bacterium]